MSSNYGSNDPRSRLTPKKASITLPEQGLRAPSIGNFWEHAPQETDSMGNPTWILRSANAVIALSQVQEGAVLSRDNNPDEYMVLMDSHCSAQCFAGSDDDDRLEAVPASLTIVPPGKSRVVCRGSGYVLRCFTSRAGDLMTKAMNATAYADGAPECAPLVNWPDPPAGFKLRNYDLLNMQATTFAHIIRSTNLMFSSMMRKTQRRADTALSPHSHRDFEQFSITLEGSWMHYLRYPWGPNKNHWRADAHVAVNSPSATVIPAGVIHTSQDVGEGVSWLIDIFAPVREDFSRQEGWVLNAEDYPAPDSPASRQSGNQKR